MKSGDRRLEQSAANRLVSHSVDSLEDSSVRIGADHLAAADCTERNPDRLANRALHEVDRAISEQAIHAAGMPAARSHILLPFGPLGPTSQHLDGLAVAE